MDKKEILQELQYNKGYFPKKAVEAAIDLHDEIVPDLNNILIATKENYQGKVAERYYFAHLYAMFLLAKFREKSAFPLIIDLISIPAKAIEDLLGDVITEDLNCILASVYNGDFVSLKELIENEDVNQFVREAGIKTLVSLAVHGIITREKVVEYFKYLWQAKLVPQEIYVGLTVACCDLYPEELMEEIKSAYKQGLVSDGYIKLSSVIKTLEEGKENVLNETKNSRFYSLIDDVVQNMEWWNCFNKNNNMYMEDINIIKRLNNNEGKLNKSLQEQLKDRLTNIMIEYFFNIPQSSLKGKTLYEFLLINRGFGNFANENPEIKETGLQKKLLEKSPLNSREFKYNMVYEKTGGVLNIFNPPIKKNKDYILKGFFKEGLNKKEAISKWLNTSSDVWNNLTPKLIWAGGGEIENKLLNDFTNYFAENFTGNKLNLDGETREQALEILETWQETVNPICQNETPMTAIIEERKRIYEKKKKLIKEFNLKSDF